jgi:hypothetical protein
MVWGGRVAGSVSIFEVVDGLVCDPIDGLRPMLGSRETEGE